MLDSQKMKKFTKTGIMEVCIERLWLCDRIGYLWHPSMHFLLFLYESPRLIPAVVKLSARLPFLVKTLYIRDPMCLAVLCSMKKAVDYYFFFCILSLQRISQERFYHAQPPRSRWRTTNAVCV